MSLYRLDMATHGVAAPCYTGDVKGKEFSQEDVSTCIVDSMASYQHVVHKMWTSRKY